MKNYDLERRRLSADVTLHRSTLDLKQREGNPSFVDILTTTLLLALRRVVDTKNRLETIYAEQRQLNQSAAAAEQDRRAAELMAKMAVGSSHWPKGHHHESYIQLTRMWKVVVHIWWINIYVRRRSERKNVKPQERSKRKHAMRRTRHGITRIIYVIFR